MPVFLPALALLAEVYSEDFLAPLGASPLPRAAIAHFAHQLVWRAGSSNVRAKEESSGALLKLARCEAVGCAAVTPWVLRPLSNSKSAHACIGRLELLRQIIAEFGLGPSSGLELKEVLAFILPLCEAASQGARDAAVGIVLDVRAADVARAEALIEDLRPSVLPMLKARLAPPEAKPGLGALSVSGRRLPPIGGAAMASADGDEVMQMMHGTPPGHEARAKARQTGVELGVRGPPVARKKSSKAAKPSPGAADAYDDDLLREASALMGESASTLRFGPPLPTAGGEPTEEELMAEILEATK